MGEGGLGGSPARRATQTPKAAKNGEASGAEGNGPGEESRDQEANG